MLLVLSGTYSQEGQQLTKAEKIYGLSKLWSEVRANYVNFEGLPFDWDDTYLEFLDKVDRTGSTFEYYMLLQKMCARIKDGHTLVILPNDVRLTYWRSLPLRTELVENKVIVTAVYNDSLMELGIKKGDEVHSINGLDVQQYAERYIMPYVSASTLHDLKFRTYTYELFKGHKDSLVRIGIKHSNNKMEIHKLSRTMERNRYQSKPKIAFKMTRDSIGVLTLNTFSGKGIVSAFDSIYPLIMKTKGLVIDNRNNGGGSSSPGYHIISHMVDTPFYGTFWVSRQEIPKIQAGLGSGESFYFQRRKRYEPVNGKQYDRPVVLLISPATYSAAEDFSAIFKQLSIGDIIGQPSGGSSGQPIRFKLPGGGQFKVCTERNSFPDGREFVGIGVQPNIMVGESVRAYRSNKDLTMAKAFEVLLKKSKRF